MKGFTTVGSINRLEKEVDDIKNAPVVEVTAKSVSYDNTSSGLTADDVQEAIDELNTAIGQINPLPFNYSETEHEVGTWIDGSTLYEKTFTTTSPTQVNTTTDIVDLSDIGIDLVVKVEAFIELTANISPMGGGAFIAWARRKTLTQDDTIACQVSNTDYLNSPMYVTVRYTKTAPEPEPEANTRKKSSKK